MRPHGRARVSSRNPNAFGICDRCNFLYNHNELSWQFDWRGAALLNTRVLVCHSCYDTPQQQLRAIVIPADPTPVQNPRVQDYVTAETSTRYTSGQNSIDPITGIPVIGGNVRVTSTPTGGLLLLEDGSGAILLEDGVSYLVQENSGAAATTDDRVLQQTGEPPGGLNTQPGTDPNAPGDNNPGLPYDYTQVPKTGPLN